MTFRWGPARGIAAILFFVFALTARALAAPPPVKAFGSLPAAEYARISPDAHYLAVVKPYAGREKAVIVDLTKDNSKPYVVGMQDANVGEVHWKGDHLIAIFHANFKKHYDRNFRMFARAVSADPAKRRYVLMMYNAPYFKANRNTGIIDDIAADDPDHVYIPEIDKWDRELIYDLFRVDVRTGAADLARHGNWHTIRFLTDGYSHVLGRIDQDGDLTNHVFVGGTEVYSYSVNGKENFAIAGLAAGKPERFVVSRPSATGTTGLYAWTPSSKFGPALFEKARYDVSPVYDVHDQRVIGARYVDDLTRYKYFDSAMQSVQTALEHAFPGQSVEIVSWDASRTKYVIVTNGPKNPPALYMYNRTNHQVRLIQDAYPQLKPDDLGTVKPYPYKARDGLDIHAYLTLPPDKDAHNLPLVVFPHGGPEARDSMEFNWWAQFMASRGYAVFQPNFRGSSGYGSRFVMAGDGEWAGKVQYDVQDGVHKLIADGIVDPKRICIVGASYGGYMALAGATYSPDLYACAVSYAGVSDLRHFLYRGTTFESEISTLWKRRVGSEDSAKLDLQSPDKYATRVKAPVLLIHSDRDATVPIRQSRLEKEALEDAGKTVRLVTLKGDDHYLETAKARIKLLKAIETFLAAHLGKG